MEPSNKTDDKKRIRTKPARSTKQPSAKRVKTTTDIVLPFKAILSCSPTGILTGAHGVSFQIHCFLDLPSLLALLATCKAARFRQMSNLAWQPLLLGHGLPIPAQLTKPLPATKLVNRFTKTPTVAAKATYKAIKNGVAGLGYSDRSFAKLAPPKLEDKIRAQTEAIDSEELKIEELKKKLATAESRLTWLQSDKKKMERMKPVAVIFDQAKKASTHLNKVLASRRKPRVKKAAAVAAAVPAAPLPSASFDAADPFDFDLFVGLDVIDLTGM